MKTNLLYILLGIVLSVSSSTVVNAQNTTYYLDSKQGSDTADGLSEKHAWKTLAKVNQLTFEPGDKVLFKSGGRWVGKLTLTGSGTEGNPIQVGRYGNGKAPLIAGEGKESCTVLLRNGSHWVIEDLEVTNTIPGGKRRDRMKGVSVEVNAGGVFKNITLRRLYVHHVSGGWDRSGGAGIWVGATGDAEDGSTRKSRYDDVLIEDCYVHNVSFYAIMFSGWENRFRDERWYPSTNVVIRNNFTRDSGGDSIVVISCDKPLLENNEGHRAAIGQSNGGNTHAAGMWPHSCDGTIMRYNKVVGIDARRDGQAFDVDINCRNTLIEYNWSQNNKRGFLLLCSPNMELPGTSEIVVRNNLSIDDGERDGLFQLTPNIKDIRIENNAFINSSKKERGTGHSWFPKNRKVWDITIHFENNIFSTPGKFVWKAEERVKQTFKNNSYSGEFQAGTTFDHTNIQVKYPAVKVENGKVSATNEGSTFKPFDVSKAGLLPTSSWIKQRDESLEKSLNRGLK